MGAGSGLMIEKLGGKDQAIEKRYYMTFPENLHVITDENDPTYDPRIKLPLDKNMVRNIMQFGVHDAVEVEMVNDLPVVRDGKQRWAHLIEANKRLVKQGGERWRIGVKPVKGDSVEMLGLMIFKNEVRRDNNSMAKAKLLQRYMETGKSVQEARLVFGCSEATIRNMQALNNAAPQVQAAVEKGLPASVAIAMVEKGLSEEQQVATLKDMEATGAVKGAAAAQAVKDSAEGKPVGTTQVRMQRTKPQLERMQAALAEADPFGKGDLLLLAQSLTAWWLGDDKALAEYPDLAKIARAAVKQPTAKGKAAK